MVAVLDFKPEKSPFDNTGVMFRSGSGAKLSFNVG